MLIFLSFFPRELRAGQLAAQQGRRSAPEHAGSQRDVIVTARGHELLQPLRSTRPQVMLCSCSGRVFGTLGVAVCPVWVCDPNPGMCSSADGVKTLLTAKNKDLFSYFSTCWSGSAALRVSWF